MFMYDYLVNNLPMSFNGTFVANRDVPNARPTRQSNLLHIPRCDSNFARKLPYYFLPSVWNEWARLIPDGHSRSQVKRLVKKHKFSRYLDHVNCDNQYCHQCNPEV